MFVDVIVDITHEKLDKIFQYSIPDSLEGVLKVGMEVVVPFGRGNKEINGYIISFSDTTEYEVEKIKSVMRVVTDSVGIEANLIRLAAYIKTSYGGTMIQAIKTVLPVKTIEADKEKRVVKRFISKEEGEKKLSFYLEKNQKARARLMAALLDQEVWEYKKLINKVKIGLNIVKALEEQGVLMIESEKVYRNPVAKSEAFATKADIIYTEEQMNAIQTFASNIAIGKSMTYLIHGVTGSGKTEVYIEMIRTVVQVGQQAIVLIPEISLTYQTVQRFYRVFGERVSILNSRMSKGERFDQWERAKKGDLDVMIGPRSALFTPFSNLGLIVIDEEHEQTYKSEQTPRYHARETAIERARIEGASVVLGSATPAIESYYHARSGRYQLLELKERSMKQNLPKVQTVDMREELKKGNRSIISDPLRTLIEQRIAAKEQVILFLNRRGYAGFISCRSCGYVEKCIHCDISLSEHRGNRMVCHYCGYEKKREVHCPTCGSKHILGFRAGTQQIEELIQKEFKGARVLRLDMDTTREKNGHERILSAFSKGEADILVGTQMIVKGHDFPNVTLVGILAADLSLYANDYRAGERTFQLVTQAAGRAGRGEKEGDVIIQTYAPDHYSIIAASEQNYQKFYQTEIGYRELMGYPPAEQFMSVMMQGKNEAVLEVAANYTCEFIHKAKKERDMAMIGPTKPYVSKINDFYRQVIFLKAENYDILIDVKDKLEKYIELNRGFDQLRIQFDFNPMNIW